MSWNPFRRARSRRRLRARRAIQSQLANRRESIVRRGPFQRRRRRPRLCKPFRSETWPSLRRRGRSSPRLPPPRAARTPRANRELWIVRAGSRRQARRRISLRLQRRNAGGSPRISPGFLRAARKRLHARLRPRTRPCTTRRQTMRHRRFRAVGAAMRDKIPRIPKARARVEGGAINRNRFRRWERQERKSRPRRARSC